MTDDRKPLEHTGGNNCPACRAMLELGKAITNVINASRVSNADRIETVVRTLAIGIKYVAEPGYEHEAAAATIARLVDCVSKVFAATGTTAETVDDRMLMAPINKIPA